MQQQKATTKRVVFTAGCVKSNATPQRAAGRKSYAPGEAGDEKEDGELGEVPAGAPVGSDKGSDSTPG